MGRKSTQDAPGERIKLQQACEKTERELLSLKEGLFDEGQSLRISYVITLTNEALSLRIRSEYQALKANGYFTPGLVATLLAIWEFCVAVYEAVKWFIDFFKIKEIIRIIEVVRYISPKFRAWTDKLLGGVRELSEKIGLGADGLFHMLHAIQGVLSTTGSMLGKDWQWLESASVEKIMKATQEVALWGEAMANDPIGYMNQVFTDSINEDLEEAKSTWDQIWKGLADGLEWGEKALESTKELTESLRELEVSLPAKVRNLIPQSVWSEIGRADELLETQILPKFTVVNTEIQKLTAHLVTHDELVTRHEAQIKYTLKQLKRPGDLLIQVDELSLDEMHSQLAKIDEVSARTSLDEMKIYDEEDSEIIAALDRIEAAGISPSKPPAFMTLEATRIPQTTPDNSGRFHNWFVGDY